MYNLKYFSDAKDLTNNTIRVEIYEKDFSGSSEEINITNININYPSNDFKFLEIRSSGAEFQILSATANKFREFFTYDIFKYPVNIKKNSALIWTGFINTEYFNEPFTYNENYLINVSANDGLILLDRLEYTDINNLPYTGYTSFKDIITNNILSDLNILSTYSTYINFEKRIFSNKTDTKPLSNSGVLNENFIDNNNIPLKKSDVLKEILKSFGLTIIRSKGKFYIIEIKNIYSGSLNFKDGNPIPNFSENIVYNLQNYNANWINNSANVDIIPAKNSVKLIYSPFTQENVYENIDFSDEKKRLGMEVLDTKPIYSNEYYIRYSGQTTAQIWTDPRCNLIHIENKKEQDNPIYFYEYKPEQLTTGQPILQAIYLQYRGNKNWISKIDNKIIITKLPNGRPVRSYTTAQFKQVFKIVNYLNTPTYYFGDNKEGSNNEYYISWCLKHDQTGKYLLQAGRTESWEDTLQMNFTRAGNPDIDNETLIYTPIEFSGTYTFSIINYCRFYSGNNYWTLPSITFKMMIKSFENYIVDMATGEKIVGKDINTEAIINENYYNKLEDVKLIISDSYTNSPSDFGGIRGSDYNYIGEWCDTSSSIEGNYSKDLLITDITNQYKDPCLKITGTIYSKELFSNLFPYSVITDDTEANKKFMMTGSNFNIYNQFVDIELTEIKNNDIIINE